ncbi:uncharacterized protein [Epargyreus clarus]|uniref:uncharacterized protein n=1 Tax=Epargyreus clarus TaxID=520877 RepID=UPI003C30462A
MSWTNDVVLEFLDLYRQEQLLWDPKHPLHRNRSEVTDAWHRIQSTLSITCSITDLKRKKESLMTSFRMHWNKKKKSPDVYHISWFAFALMESFLGGKYECDSTNQTENELIGNASPYMQQAISDHNTNRHDNGPERSNPSAVRHRPSISQVNSAKTKDFICTKKEIDDGVAYFHSVDDRNDLDEYDLYGQLLAKKLRKLDEHQRDVAMHEIDNIMFRVKVQNKSPQNRTYTSSPSPVSRRMKSPVFIVTQPSQIQYEDENVPYEGHMQGQPPP